MHGEPLSPPLAKPSSQRQRSVPRYLLSLHCCTLAGDNLQPVPPEHHDLVNNHTASLIARKFAVLHSTADLDAMDGRSQALPARFNCTVTLRGCVVEAAPVLALQSFGCY